MTPDIWTWSWIKPASLIACSYPPNEAALRHLSELGVCTLINLDEVRHDPATLDSIGLAEVHIPIPDFTAPTSAQIDYLVEAVREAQPMIAVHCRAGLGRTGTMLACLLVADGLTADEAIAQIRMQRPGSIETPAQEAAARTFAERTKQQSKANT
jgi:atypical dual specificity phosphatase